ncbi:MazG family protein [[Clostridium] symbiosum]|uniref:MazG family protein n=1 Tax=Clostridium symbiosum TaxID=1512 RepID=UPI001D08DBAC|nr:MazG family protein [[Clostridium] symbiosum]MCB6609616.1 MazG family protein [[Clostridium] symbiosum]MCB6933142.1 MazG family protein [[Clostridium] symbiosum]
MEEMRKKYTFDDLKDIMRTLRSENGCPWDRRQTHESLIPCLEEEAGEVIDAIRENDPENLCEELGDLLFQVMSHSQIAEEKGLFTIDDVVDGVSAKMIRRHPNVFGDEKVNSAEEGLDLWNRIKSEEKSKKAQKTLTKQG